MSPITEDISVARPVQRLDSVRVPAAEQEQAVLTQLLSILQLVSDCQTVDSSLQVCVSYGDVVVPDPAHV